MNIVFGILYSLFGVLLAIPYCLLAGWSAERLPIMALVAPVFLFTWFMAASLAGIIEPRGRGTIQFNWRAAFGKSNRRVQSSSLSFFWGWTLYSFLPVILHWSAVVIGKIGYETVASLIDTHRYASLLYVFIAAFVLIFLIGMTTSVWNAAKNVWTRIVHRYKRE